MIRNLTLSLLGNIKETSEAKLHKEKLEFENIEVKKVRSYK